MDEWTTVAADENRLYVDLRGYGTAADGDRLTEEVRAATDRLEPGFSVVVDFREYRPAEPDAVDRLERVRRAIEAADAAATVTVLPDSATGRPHFAPAGSNGDGYAVATAESIEEAEALLDRRQGTA